MDRLAVPQIRSEICEEDENPLPLQKRNAISHYAHLAISSLFKY
jgi:hypothetical protein